MSYGATVQLTRTWVSLVSNPAFSVQLDGAVINEAPTVTGEVRQYAGGRQRAVSMVGVANQITVQASLVAKSTMDTLVSWLAQPLLFRDPFGRKYYAVLFSVPRSAIPGSTAEDAKSQSVQALIFHTITVNEAV